MPKFTYNNKFGIFYLLTSASFVAQITEAVAALLNVFEQSEIVKYTKENDNTYKILSLSSSDISKALHTSSYKEFLSEVNASYEYKNSLLESELNNFTP